jgi:hypothetical protein
MSGRANLPFEELQLGCLSFEVAVSPRLDESGALWPDLAVPTSAPVHAQVKGDRSSARSYLRYDFANGDRTRPADSRAMWQMSQVLSARLGRTQPPMDQRLRGNYRPSNHAAIRYAGPCHASIVGHKVRVGLRRGLHGQAGYCCSECF